MKVEKEEPDYYDVLGVTSDASVEEIEAGYKKARRTSHPDKTGNEWAFRLVTIAYETLKNPERRAAYDKRDHEPSPPSAPTPPAPTVPQPTRVPVVTTSAPRTPAVAKPSVLRVATPPLFPQTMEPDGSGDLSGWSIKPDGKKLAIGFAIIALAYLVCVGLTYATSALPTPTVVFIAPVLLMAGLGALAQNKQKPGMILSGLSIIPLLLDVAVTQEVSPVAMAGVVLTLLLAIAVIPVNKARALIRMAPGDVLRTGRTFGRVVSASVGEGKTLNLLHQLLSQTASVLDGTFIFTSRGYPTSEGALAPVRFTVVRGDRILLIFAPSAPPGIYESPERGAIYMSDPSAGYVSLSSSGPAVKDAAAALAKEHKKDAEVCVVFVVDGALDATNFAMGTKPPLAAAEETACIPPSWLPAFVHEWGKDVPRVVRRDLLKVGLAHQSQA